MVVVKKVHSQGFWLFIRACDVVKTKLYLAVSLLKCQQLVFNRSMGILNTRPKAFIFEVAYDCLNFLRKSREALTESLLVSFLPCRLIYTDGLFKD
ncbi:MAG: hypothetical protein ACXWWE_08245 [Nitrospira sp.]